MKSSPPRPRLVNDTYRHGTCSSQPRSSATLLEHSPLLDEVLRQISNSKESVHDIHTQIAECQLVTTRSYAVLQREVETYRERKQQEDAARLELKSRSKLLDDSKRGAEGAKKDADKNLRAVQVIRDNTGHQLESLQERILALQGHLLEDRDFILCHQKQSLEPAINDALEQKKADIRAAEHSVAILNQRSRELEDRLSSERERLRILRQKSEDQKLYYPFLEDIDPVSQRCDGRFYPLSPSISHSSDLNPLPLLMPGGRADLPATTTLDSQLLHYPRNADLYHSSGAAYVGNTKTGKNINPEVHQDALFDGNQTFRSGSEVVSTFGSNLNVVSREHINDALGSFGDTGPGTERNWYGNHRHLGDHSSLSIPMFIPTLSDSDRPFEAHVQSYDGPDYATPAKLDVEHTNWTQSMAVNLPVPYNIPGTDYCHATNILDQSQSTRSLASTTSLNINEFHLFDNPSFDISSDTGNASRFDALNPNGLGSVLVTPPSTSQSFLRAFAPSPAEREVLQKALSSSSNASLERLPSLSAVGSLPSSPTSCLPQHSHSLRDLSSFLPTWLKAFPRSGTVKFSPWEDEDLRNGDQFVTASTNNGTVTVIERSVLP